MTTEYVVYQGMQSPRDNTIGWREWSRFEDRESALKEGKGLSIGRVDKTETIWITPSVKTK